MTGDLPVRPREMRTEACLIAIGDLLDLHDPGPCVTKGGIRRLGWSGTSTGRAHNERGHPQGNRQCGASDLEECDKRRRSAANGMRPQWAITWGKSETFRHREGSLFVLMTWPDEC